MTGVIWMAKSSCGLTFRKAAAQNSLCERAMEIASTAKPDDSWLHKRESRASGSRRILQELFAPAGLTLDGDAAWDPKVHDERFYSRVLANGSLGLGESYVDGWWDCEEFEPGMRVLDIGCGSFAAFAAERYGVRSSASPSRRSRSSWDAEG
jgi:hypothetical protein